MERTSDSDASWIVSSATSRGGGVRFFRGRLVLICKVLAGINVGYFTLFVLALWLDSGRDVLELVREAFSAETLGEYVLLAGVAAGCRFGPQSLRALRVLDATWLLGLGMLWASWCFIHPYPALGAYEMVLALVAAPVLRAVLVPSSGLRTFLLTTLACLPGLAASFVASRVRNLTMMTPATLTVLVLNWCAISVVFSTVASSVIYGLRSQVRRARRLGQYTLLAKIGQGGMGVVYLARHALLRRKTVVKLINADASPEAVNRFEREVQLTSQLTHPNTIAVYDFGRTAEGTFYYAMEHLEGSDLERVVSATGPMPAARVIHVLRQVCGALEEAHAAGLIHRDIKPSNLFLCPRRGTTDAVKVLDFGLAKELSSGPRDASLTLADALVGTPLYMSPELVLPDTRPDARSDLYALGAVAYYLLTGVTLFAGSSAIAVLSQHLTATPVPPSERGMRAIPEDLERIVLRCLEKKPEARFPSARALREALDTCKDASAWSEADAFDWWQAQASELVVKEPSGDLESSGPPTIAIDLRRRQPVSSPAFEAGEVATSATSRSNRARVGLGHPQRGTLGA